MMGKKQQVESCQLGQGLHGDAGDITSQSQGGEGKAGHRGPRACPRWTVFDHSEQLGRAHLCRPPKMLPEIWEPLLYGTFVPILRRSGRRNRDSFAPGWILSAHFTGGKTEA